MHDHNHNHHHHQRPQVEGKTKEVTDKSTMLDTTNKELNDARTKITALMIVQEGACVRAWVGEQQGFVGFEGGTLLTYCYTTN